MSRMFRSILVAALILTAAIATAAEFPPVGKPAPDFYLRNQDAKGVGLSDFRGKWVVLYFYARDFRPECTTQARNFQRDLPKYEAANAVVVGVGIDGPHVHRSFADLNELKFPLLADTNAEVMRTYNSYIEHPPGKVTDRNTFLIDPEGNVRKIFTKVNPSTNSAQVLKALAELQGTEKKN